MLIHQSIKFKQSYIYKNKKACDMPGFFSNKHFDTQ